MAISKVALGATALLEKGVIREIRLGAASLAPFPTRLGKLKPRCSAKPSRAKPRNPRAARCSPKSKPIDDIRSTAEYRSRVAAICSKSFCSDCARRFAS
jgi:CO/xanthine dehydrogenase FAD-binding subunit